MSRSNQHGESSNRHIHANHDQNAFTNDDMHTLVTKAFSKKHVILNDKLIPISPLAGTLEHSYSSVYRDILNIPGNTKEQFKAEKERQKGEKIIISGLVAGISAEGSGGHYYMLTLHVTANDKISEVTIYNSTDWFENLAQTDIERNLRDYTREVLEASGYDFSSAKYSYKQPYLQATDTGCGPCCLAGAYDHLIAQEQAESRRLTGSEEARLRSELVSYLSRTEVQAERLVAPQEIISERESRHFASYSGHVPQTYYEEYSMEIYKDSADYGLYDNDQIHAGDSEKTVAGDGSDMYFGKEQPDPSAIFEESRATTSGEVPTISYLAVDYYNPGSQHERAQETRKRSDRGNKQGCCIIS